MELEEEYVTRYIDMQKQTTTKNKESSYIQYLDANNLYGWPMCQKLPVNGFK